MTMIVSLVSLNWRDLALIILILMWLFSARWIPYIYTSNLSLIAYCTVDQSSMVMISKHHRLHIIPRRFPPTFTPYSYQRFRAGHPFRIDAFATYPRLLAYLGVSPSSLAASQLGLIGMENPQHIADKISKQANALIPNLPSLLFSPPGGTLDQKLHLNLTEEPQVHEGAGGGHEILCWKLTQRPKVGRYKTPKINKI